MTAQKAADVQVNPRTLAVLMTDPPTATHGLGIGRKWTAQDGAKRVRSIARDNIDRFVNRTGRTAHLYTVAEARAIVAEAQRAGSNGGGVSADDARSALGSKPAAPRSKASKPALSADKGTDAA